MAHDRIHIKNLLLRTIIGLNDWEREKRQDVLINLTLFTDMRAAGQSDDAADVLNYRTITKAVIAYVEGSQHYLVEALATEIARICVVDHGVWCSGSGPRRCSLANTGAPSPRAEAG